MTRTLPKPPPVEAPVLSIPSLLAGEWARETLLSVATGQPRSLQAELGPSEIGQVCERRLAYRILGTPYVNHPDPTKALVGTGFHVAAADGLRRLDGGRWRYLVEVPVSYRGVSGSVDFFDRVKHRVGDWKTTSTSRIARYRRDGISTNYHVQIAIYAEALRAQGEQVDQMALIFVPRDGELSDIYAWVGEPDKALADRYVDRYHAIAEKARIGGAAALPVTPGPLCSYCPNHMTRAADLAVSCPGVKEVAR